MKSFLHVVDHVKQGSPPSRGAWIEMSRAQDLITADKVAPLAGGVD